MYNVFKVIILSTFLFSVMKSQAMLRALNTAATGMAAQDAHVATISNNIANVNTTGYKQQRVEFEDLAYETVVESGSRSSTSSLNNVGVQIGSGTKVSGIKRSFEMGSPKLTNNPFDFMVNGEGFFAIQLPNGSLSYTRDGAFSVDNTGTLVTKHGYKVFPGFTFPPGTKSVSVSHDGQVDVYMANQVQPIQLGQMPIFTFINSAGLKSTGQNMFRITASSGQPIQNIAGTSNAGDIQQGTLETSNVSIMTEMTNLIKAQRSYEMNSKVMGVADQMLQTVNNIR